MNRIVIVIALLVVLGAAGYFFLRPYFEPRSMPPPPAPKAEAPKPPVASGPKYPIVPEAKPLPPLGASDPAIQEALVALLGSAAVQKFLNIEETVRRIVATVDNLPRETIALRLNPVKPIGGLLATTGEDSSLAIGPKNAARYTPFVKLADSVDSGKLVGAYVHFYPLFQQAYVDLGYPGGYFNDRLVEVIDHLLATPDVRGPIKLVTPKVLYQYADPELEKRSAGQKILIRMGSENAAKIKAKLQEVRSLLVTRKDLSAPRAQ